MIINFSKTLSTLTRVTLLSLCPTFLFAGQGGNGGDVIVCNNQEKPIVFFLDTYEAQAQGLDYDLGQKNEDYKIHLERFLKRMNRLSPNYAKILKKRINPMIKDIELYRSLPLEEKANKENIPLSVINFTSGQLVDIADSYHLALPQGCKLDQIVVQTTPVSPYKIRYHIQKYYFDFLDEQSVTSLIIHEATYPDYFEKKWSDDSTDTRALNNLFSSSRFKEMSAGEFAIVLYERKFQSLETPDYILNLKYCSYNTDENSEGSHWDFEIFKNSYKIELKTFEPWCSIDGTRLKFKFIGSNQTFYFDDFRLFFDRKSQSLEQPTALLINNKKSFSVKYAQIIELDPNNFYLQDVYKYLNKDFSKDSVTYNKCSIEKLVTKIDYSKELVTWKISHKSKKTKFIELTEDEIKFDLVQYCR